MTKERFDLVVAKKDANLTQIRTIAFFIDLLHLTTQVLINKQLKGDENVETYIKMEIMKYCDQ